MQSQLITHVSLCHSDADTASGQLECLESQASCRPAAPQLPPPRQHSQQQQPTPRSPPLRFNDAAGAAADLSSQAPAVAHGGRLGDANAAALAAEGGDVASPRPPLHPLSASQVTTQPAWPLEPAPGTTATAAAPHAAAKPAADGPPARAAAEAASPAAGPAEAAGLTPSQGTTQPAWDPLHEPPPPELLPDRGVPAAAAVFSSMSQASQAGSGGLRLPPHPPVIGQQTERPAAAAAPAALQRHERHACQAATELDGRLPQHLECSETGSAPWPAPAALPVAAQRLSTPEPERQEMPEAAAPEESQADSCCVGQPAAGSHSPRPVITPQPPSCEGVRQMPPPLPPHRAGRPSKWRRSGGATGNLNASIGFSQPEAWPFAAHDRSGKQPGGPAPAAAQAAAAPAQSLPPLSPPAQLSDWQGVTQSLSQCMRAAAAADQMQRDPAAPLQPCSPRTPPQAGLLGDVCGAAAVSAQQGSRTAAAAGTAAAATAATAAGPGGLRAPTTIAPAALSVDAVEALPERPPGGSASKGRWRNKRLRANGILDLWSRKGLKRN